MNETSRTYTSIQLIEVRITNAGSKRNVVPYVYYRNWEIEFGKNKLKFLLLFDLSNKAVGVRRRDVFLQDFTRGH